jgi:Ser/Thr protein kinase RdoA (MazF antagonist)
MLASDPDVQAALDRHDLRARCTILISPPDVRKLGRCMYRVDLADGGTIKVRRLESADAAHRLLALRAEVETAFAPAIATHGAVLLEAWIAGAPLADRDAAAHAAEAGALLGRLHARPAADPPATVATGPWRERATTELATLAAAGKLAPATVATLVAALSRADPERASTTIVHQDFCAENMLIDARGRLRVIDNEWFTIGPPGLDLGRTFTRWPMAEETWRRFHAAYCSAMPADPGALTFWTITTAATSACIRLQKSAERLQIPLALLRRVAAAPGDHAL